MGLLQQKVSLVVGSFAVLVGVTALPLVYEYSIRAEVIQSPPPEISSGNRNRIVEIEDPEWRRGRSLKALISQSEAVIIGVAVRNRCRPTQDGNQVSTDYEIRVDEVMKGAFTTNSSISVSMPGGLVKESNSGLLEVRARGVRRMQNGKRYLLFLKNAPGNSNTPYTIVAGSQGLYEIPPSNSKMIHLGRSLELAPADDGPDAAAFLQTIRMLTGRR